MIIIGLIYVTMLYQLLNLYIAKLFHNYEDEWNW